MRKFTGYEFDSLADTHGFAAFYPDGYQSNWNDCLKAGAVAATLEHVDDVGFILALIGKAQSEFKIDPKRVYLVGYSNGGQLAMTLANLSPGPAAGIAIFGADVPTPDNSTCLQDSRTPPIMIVAGTDDPISPYNGGEVSIFGFQNKGTVVSAPATAEAFARRNGIGTPLSEEMLPHRDPRDPTSVQRLTRRAAMASASSTSRFAGCWIRALAWRCGERAGLISCGRSTRSADGPWTLPDELLSSSSFAKRSLIRSGLNSWRLLRDASRIAPS
jgi:polyhydroxybutyrate depolymerase